MKKLLIIGIGSLMLATGCQNSSTSKPKTPVAKVYDKYLYAEDISHMIPKELSQADSLAIITDFIDKWVLKQLLLHQAETNLSEEDKDVEQQIDDYRTSLLIFKYEQGIIQQQIDTAVSQQEMMDYYDQYSSNFILNQNLVKSLLIVLPNDAPNMWKVRNWYRSDKDEDFTLLEGYCYENGKSFDYNDEQWVVFDDLISKIPNFDSDAERFLKYRKYQEFKDDENIYILRIYDYRLAGTVAPMEYVEEKIKSILINKRKVQIINSLESDIYNNALNHGHFNVY